MQVRGVVKPGTGGSHCEDGTWNLHFTFAAWRIVGGSLMRTPLHLSFNRPDREAMSAAWKLVPNDAVVVVRCESLDEHRGRVLAIESPGAEEEADEELHAVGIELAQPTVRAHPFFGEMRYNRALGWFEAQRTMATGTYSVSISVEDVDDDMSEAEEAVRRFEDRVPKLTAEVARGMLPLYNDTWREKDAPVESEATFAARLGLPSVTVDEDGELTLYYADDDLFAGHSIEVFLNEAGEVADATLSG